MDYNTPFAAVTADSGIASEVLHVSPMFVRFGPPTRGNFADRRAARVLRTDARQARRAIVAQQPGSLEFTRFFRS
jgi:hypothetical protein